MALNEYRPRKIKVYRNGDVFSHAKKIVVSAKIYRNYEQFLYSLAGEVKLTSGAVRKVYSMDGQLVRALEELEDGASYVAAGQEPFKKAPYVQDDDDSSLKATGRKKERPRVSYGMLNSELNHIMDVKEKPIFGPSSKAFNVLVFSNGEPKHPLKMLLNHRNCRTFDQLMRVLSAALRLPTGQVHRIYDATTYERINSLQGIHNGQNMIAVTHEPLKRVPYEVVDLNFKSRRAADIIRIVTFFPNGDPYHNGISVTVTKRKFPTMQKLLDHCNNQIELYTGKIQNIYAVEPRETKIQSVDEIEGGKYYILVANNDPLINIRYNTKAIKYTHSVGLSGATLKNEYMSHIRKAPETWSKNVGPNSKQNSFREQTPKPKPKSAFKRPTEEDAIKREKSRGKTPEKSRPVTSNHEGVGTDDHYESSPENEEIYGEKDLQYLKSKNDKIPRTPTPKKKASTPYHEEEADSPLNRSEVNSAHSNARSEVKSAKSNARSDAKSAQSLARSSVKSRGREAESGDEDAPESPVTRRSDAASKRGSNEELKVSAKERVYSPKTPSLPKSPAAASNKGSGELK